MLLRNGPRLNVSSCGMVVSLHGFVENAAHRERAEEVTSSVRGVEGVINKLRTP
ncbi:MAG: BON domain-containing protein [Rubrobacter sp.]